MKKIDYYAVQNPWRMPKWLGATLGGIFGVIVIGSMITIVQLTKSNVPAPVAVVASASVTPAAAPVAAATAVKTTAPVASADEAAPVEKHRSSKHHAAASHGKKGKMFASAKRAPAMSTMGSAQRQTILAKHDTKDKRHEKDALDKLLGL